MASLVILFNVQEEGSGNESGPGPEEDAVGATDSLSAKPSEAPTRDLAEAVNDDKGIPDDMSGRVANGAEAEDGSASAEAAADGLADRLRSQPAGS